MRNHSNHLLYKPTSTLRRPFTPETTRTTPPHRPQLSVYFRMPFYACFLQIFALSLLLAFCIMCSHPAPTPATSSNHTKKSRPAMLIHPVAALTTSSTHMTYHRPRPIRLILALHAPTPHRRGSLGISDAPVVRYQPRTRFYLQTATFIHALHRRWYDLRTLRYTITSSHWSSQHTEAGYIASEM